MSEITTRRQMRDLRDGDEFFVNGERHVARGDAHLSGDASCDEYIVYDENSEGWFETDFPEKQPGKKKGNLLLQFSFASNKDHVQINVMTFHLKDGTTIALDRDRSGICRDPEPEGPDRKWHVEWENLYMWRVNNEPVFESQTAYVSPDIAKLLRGAWAEPEPEDEEDEDCVVRDLSWYLYHGGICIAQGGGSPA